MASDCPIGLDCFVVVVVVVACACSWCRWVCFLGIGVCVMGPFFCSEVPEVP